MLRVDHAGEFGANRIYAGQMAVLGNFFVKIYHFIYRDCSCGLEVVKFNLNQTILTFF
jgi:hypothetical protein